MKSDIKFKKNFCIILSLKLMVIKIGMYDKKIWDEYYFNK